MSEPTSSRKRKRDPSPPRGLAFKIAPNAIPPNQLGPVLVNFPCLSAPSSMPFKAYSNKKSRTTVAGETDAVEFETNGEETSRVEENSGCRYVIAIHNKRTSALTVLPHAMSPHVLTRTVKALKSIPPAAAPSATEYFQARTALGETFGTKKAKAAIRARERNKVDVGAMEGAIDFVMAGIDKGAEGLMTKESAKELADTNRAVPPFNTDTDDVEEVYPLHGIIPEAEWKALSVSAFYEAGSAEDRRALLPARHSSWVNARVEATMAGSKGKDMKRILKILFYISCMMDFRHQISRKQTRETLSERLALVPESVVESLLSRFTQTSRDSTRPRSTPDLDLRLLGHMFALCLRVDNYAADHAAIAHDLSMATDKVALIFKNLGCKITKLTERERTKLGLPDSVAEETRAVLRAPLKFPKARVKRKA